MKKNLLTVGMAIVIALGLASCSSVRHTSTTVDVNTSVVSPAIADLSVSPKKISYTFKPSKAVRRTGERGVIETAVAQALKENKNADVLVGFEYEIKKTRNFFGKTSIKYVIVEGYPAKYVNIRTPEK